MQRPMVNNIKSCGLNFHVYKNQFSLKKIEDSGEMASSGQRHGAKAEYNFQFAIPCYISHVIF